MFIQISSIIWRGGRVKIKRNSIERTQNDGRQILKQSCVTAFFIQETKQFSPTKYLLPNVVFELAHT